MKPIVQKDYDGFIIVEDQRINYRVSNSIRLEHDLIQFHLVFFDSKGNNLGVMACCDKQYPVSRNVAKETYIKLLNNGF